MFRLNNNSIGDTITMTFETDMFSSSNFQPYSWLRVKVDGNVISDSYGNTSYNNTNLPYTFGGNTVLSYDLSSFAGSTHYITLSLQTDMVRVQIILPLKLCVGR